MNIFERIFNKECCRCGVLSANMKKVTTICSNDNGLIIETDVLCKDCYKGYDLVVKCIGSNFAFKTGARGGISHCEFKE